jgi:hypothetical protein
MPTRRTTVIGFGDLLLAVERLQVRQPSLAGRVAMLLDVDAASTGREAMTVVNAGGPLEVEPIPTKQRLEPAAAPIGTTVPSAIVQRSATAPVFAIPVPPLPPAGDEENEPPLPFEPLFLPSSARAMAAAALATSSASGSPDIDAVVGRIAAGLAVVTVPRKAMPTLRKGAQVLVDRASGMIPFARDADWLVRELISVGGAESSSALYFRGLPSRGVADRRRRVRGRYQPPLSGVPVVLLSDFAIGFDELASDRATAGEWIEFLESLRRQGHSLVAFVPYPRRRCPGWLLRMTTVIEWDRRTTLGRIHAAMRQSWSSR